MWLTAKSIVMAMTLTFVIAPVVARADDQDLKTQVLPGASANQTAPVAQPQSVTHSSVSLEKDSASSVGHHHYNSDAERAQDDLLITEVKSALLNDGISKDYPVQVDADHGTVVLRGVVASADDVKAAADDAAGIQGVIAVKNELRVHAAP